MVKNVRVLTGAWNGDVPLNLAFPDNWDVIERKMHGHDFPELTDGLIAKKIDEHIGGKSLDDIVSGRNECAIIINDSCRPFKHNRIAPILLNRIQSGGIPNENIRFIIGSGAHSWTTLDYIKKILGDSIPENYLVFNHNCYENNFPVGKTSRGTIVNLNREVLNCDLKISLHGIIPHELAGFGGGSKIILPGVSSIETIAYNHRNIEDICKGKIEGNRFLSDLDESARLSNIDFSINQIINGRMGCSDLVCGDIVLAHRKGVKIARNWYVTESVNNADIVVANSYPMDYEPYKALYSDLVRRVNSDGHIVVLAHDPRGLRGHYLTGRFGKNYGSRMWNPSKIVDDVKIVVVCPFRSLADEAEACGVNSTWVRSWSEALNLLTDIYDNPKVAVYPTASIQMSESEAKQE